MRYLASQQQERLPYRIPYVNSNDQIFIGNEGFTTEAENLMDFCFSQVLDTITRLNEQKNQFSGELFTLCLTSANLLIGIGNTGNKQIGAFINKMFKMADGFMADYNAKLPANAHPDYKLNRNFINKSFDAFKKKKETAIEEQKKATSRQTNQCQ